MSYFFFYIKTNVSQLQQGQLRVQLFNSLIRNTKHAFLIFNKYIQYTLIHKNLILGIW